MSTAQDTVTVVELKAWGLDPNPYRPAQLAEPEQAYGLSTHTLPKLENETFTQQARASLERAAVRADLQAEFRGLDWRLAVVNLRALIAFQRRLAFPRRLIVSQQPTQLIDPHDWDALAALAFGPPRSTAHRRIDAGTIVSSNPDLVLRPAADGWKLYGGSPFFEVASYGGRAFLRDGYHRAYDLLSAGIDFVPAVVIAAHSFKEVGATGPNFFAESILVCERPPLVVDFLSPTLTHRYTRPRLLKSIRVQIEECFAAADADPLSAFLPTGDPTCPSQPRAATPAPQASPAAFEPPKPTCGSSPMAPSTS